jgi:hypothetical protein
MFMCSALQTEAGNGPGRKSTVAKIAVVAAALAAAVFFALRESSQDKQLDTPDSAVTFICWDDGNTVKLTPAQWARLLEQGEVQTINPGKSPTSTDPNVRGKSSGSRLTAVRCPKCRKFTCVVALDCPGGKQVPSVTAEGKPGECPSGK